MRERTSRRRRTWTSTAWALALAPALAAPAAGAAVGLAPMVTGLARPVHATRAGDGSGRLFIVEQAGRVLVLAPGSAVPEVFLDISARVRCCGEEGLLSLAFPPGFDSSGRFYVYYTALDGNNVVARFALGAVPDRADPGSEELVLHLLHPTNANHNGGQLAFSPLDGFLYAGTGDGGGGGDPAGNAQNPASLLGKVLRLDVESGQRPYGVPADNPFVASAGFRPEIWHMGLRNPWRFSFDRTTGDLWIGDVGQASWEEVDRQPAGVGGLNFGWDAMEGTHCFTPPTGCDPSGLTLPVHEYATRSPDGCAVTGGFVYRGSAYPSLAGAYLYSDACSGRIWALRRDGEVWRNELQLDSTAAVVSFAEDEGGELLVVDLNGAVWRLVGAGDVNGDGRISAADVFFGVQHLLAGGPAPVGPLDANGDGRTGPEDLFYLVAYLFAGGPSPV